MIDISKELQKELLEQVIDFVTIEEMENFTELNARSFEALTGSKYFDDLDPALRVDLTYEYNKLQEFLTKLRTLQERYHVELRNNAEVQ